MAGCGARQSERPKAEAPGGFLRAALRKPLTKVLAERLDLLQDRLRMPPMSGMPHKLKNNQHVRGNAIKHQVREAMP
jgi:hypothetical protein